MNRGNTTDKAILFWLAHKAGTGSLPALEQLLFRLKSPVCAFVARRIPRDSVDDVWQETAMAISAGIHRLTDSTTVLGWALRIARHKCADFFRQSAAAAGHRASETPESVAAPDPELDRSLYLRQLISRLDEDEQDLLFLFYTVGLSIAELSQAMSISTGNAKVRLFRARQALKTHLEGDYP